MEQSKRAISTREQIVKNYRVATYCYLTPFSLVLVGLIWDVFLPLVLLTLLPAGAIGIFFTRRGLRLASQSGDREKKDVGYANVLLGSIVLALGVFGIAIAYLATG